MMVAETKADLAVRANAKEKKNKGEAPVEIDLATVSRQISALGYLALSQHPSLSPPARALLVRHPSGSPYSTGAITYGVLRELGVDRPYVVELNSDRNHVVIDTLAELARARGIMLSTEKTGLAGVGAVIHSGVTKVRAGLAREEVSRAIADLLVDGSPIDVVVIGLEKDAYWIWSDSDLKPAVYVVVYNSAFGPAESVVVQSGYATDGSNMPGGLARMAWGASLEALARIGRAKGYKLLGVNAEADRAFFVQADDPVFPEVSAFECYKALYSKFLSDENTPKLRIRLQEVGVPLLEVELG